SVDDETLNQLTQNLFGVESANLLKIINEISAISTDPTVISYSYAGRSKLSGNTYDDFSFNLNQPQVLWENMSLETLNGSAYVDRGVVALSRIKAQATF